MVFSDSTSPPLCYKSPDWGNERAKDEGCNKNGANRSLNENKRAAPANTETLPQCILKNRAEHHCDGYWCGIKLEFLE